MDGYVTIGTKLDTNDFDDKMKKLEDKYEKKEIDVKVTSKDLKNAKEDLKSLNDEASKLNNKYSDINEKIKEQEKIIASVTRKGENGFTRVKDSKVYDDAVKQKFSLETQQRKLLPEINSTTDAVKKQEIAVGKISARYKRQRIELQGIQNEMNKIQAQKIQEQAESMKKSFEGIRNSVKGVAERITGWALAIIGVRSAYNGIRNAISIISQQDEQLAADIQYMKNALAYALEPIVRAIVNLMKQLMFYVGYIVKAWTGKNIFENANKSLKSANKQAKQLSKTLAGFDEMNVLSDTSGGGGDTGALPSFDLSSMQGEVPAWIEWIANNKNIIIPALLGIAAGLVAIKLGLVGLTGGIILGLIVGLVALILTNWDKILEVLSGGIKWLEDSVGAVRDFFGDQVADIYETWITAFKGIIIGFDMAINGIKQMLSGIVQFVKGVFTGDWKQAWEGIKNIFSGIWGAIKGLAVSVFSFISGLVVSIAKTVGYTIADVFKAVVNGVLGAIETILNAPIKAVNKLIDVINSVPGIDLGRLPTFKLPRLAKGGIINMPGRGVPIGSAIGGERGQEGVIPLTDSQQMAMLGEAIGKYINVSATIPVYVGNRQIARELRKINAEDEFAFNG